MTEAEKWVVFFHELSGEWKKKYTGDSILDFYEHLFQSKSKRKMDVGNFTLQRVASGSYGSVWRCQHIQFNHIKFAIKAEEQPSREQRYSCGEANVSKELQEKCHVIEVECITSYKSYKGEQDTMKNIYVMRWMDGSVRDLMKSKENLLLLEDVMKQIKTKLSCFFKQGRPYLDLHPGQIMYTKEGDTVDVWIVDLGSMIEENDEDEPSEKKYATSYPRFGVENYNSDDCCYVVDKKDSAKWIDWLCFIALAGIVLPETRGYLDVCHRCNEGPTLHNVSILVDAVKKQPVTEYERIKTFVTPIEELVKNAKTNKKRSLIEMVVGAVGGVVHLLIPEGGQNKRTRLNLEGGH